MNHVIVTMTSWKQRIETVPIVILQFLQSQTLKPDIFYLWLSIDEFPKKEDDLPELLVEMSRKHLIQIRWLSGNEYCYKRWHVYPEHYDDYVISIDDDSIHSPTLIADSLAQLSKHDDKVICNVWKQFSAVPHYDNDIKINFRYDKAEALLTRWTCATCAIPPRLFPLEALSNEIQTFTKEHLPKNDEAWLIPFVLAKGIQTTFIPRLFLYQTIPSEKSTSLSQSNTAPDAHGYKSTEKCLYLMLKKLGMLDKYTKLFPGYNYRTYERILQQAS